MTLSSDSHTADQADRGAQGPAPSGARRQAVLLVNVGTPDGPDAPSVRRYLAEFLGDPLVVRLPRGLRWFQSPLAWLIAWWRAPQSAEKYRLVWLPAGSPLRVIMDEQAAALTKVLPPGWRVFTAMRYGRPSIADTLRQITAAGIEELVVVPLYPQFSGTTTGTVIQELYAALRRSGAPMNVAARTSWYDDAGYVNAQARLIADYAVAHDLRPDNAVLLYTAHGLPVSYVARGDPYETHLRRTCELVTQRLGWPAARTRLGFQSRLGPAVWLGPDTEAVLAELAAQNERVLTCPISFVGDCLETLEEIDVRYRERFEAQGGRMYRCPALNGSPQFVAALKNLVLRGPRPVTKWSERSLLTESQPAAPQPHEAARHVQRLFMVGVSLAGRVGPGRGPRLVYSDAEQFRCVKKPQAEVQGYLRGLRASGAVPEAMIWNTCQRFEFYGWLAEESGASACTVARVRCELLGAAKGNANILLGANAWHHLMRTVIGLNSGLPGDKDVVEQLRSAYETAERAGLAGPHLHALVGEAVALAERAQTETMWGRETPGYCYATITRLQRMLGVRLGNCRHVVIGGSATARSIVRALFAHFEAHQRDVTLVYRTHQGGQTRLLRQVIGNGRRLRTDSYSAREVINAIADADVVYFGIDGEQPVLSGAVLAGLRDFAARPLTVVDFNTAGSTAGAADVPGVRLWTAARIEAEVQAFADEVCAGERFPQIVQEAEAWIEQHAPSVPAVGNDMPCVRTEELVNPRCGECGRALAELSAVEQTA